MVRINWAKEAEKANRERYPNDYAHELEDIINAPMVDIDRQMALNGLRYYVESAWDEVEPATPFVPNWHIDAICDHLEAVANGEIKRLVINVPPGTGKSLMCCVFFPTWVWTTAPQKKFITGSYADLVAKRDSLRSRQLFESDWWRARWGGVMQPNEKMWTSTHYKNKQGGFRLGVTVAGSVTGEHADIQIVDDPLKPLDIDGKSSNVTDTALDKADTWWRTTMTSRMVNVKESSRIIIMQRLHERDLAGAAIEAGYEHLLIPMNYDTSERKTTSIGFDDPRKDDGELLFPERFPEDALEVIKKEIGANAYASQYSQNPTVKGGNIFKTEFIRYYTTPEHPIPGVPMIDMRELTLIQSWDCKMKEVSTGSYCVGQVWGSKRGAQDIYLIDQVRDRWGIVGTCEALRALTLKWPKAYRKLIENKANGPSVEETLRNEITGIELVEPGGGKVERAWAAEPTWAAGNIWLPHVAIAPWIVEFVSEVNKFPLAKRDDQVDTMTQAIYHFQASGLNRLRAAMQNSQSRML